MMSTLRELTLYSRTMLGVCAVLAVVVAAEAIVLADVGDEGGAVTAMEQQAPGPDAGAPAPPLAIPPIVAYREVVERPLFSDTRRPQDKPADKVAAAPVAKLESQWKLTGVVLAGENSSAHIMGMRDNKTVRLQAGMQLDGWRLDAVERDRAVFSLNGREAILRLHEEEQQEVPVTPIRRR